MSKLREPAEEIEFLRDVIARQRAEIERLWAELAAERERCVQVVFSLVEDGDEAEECADAIRKPRTMISSKIK